MSVLAGRNLAPRPRTHYEVLLVDRRADLEIISLVYRRLAQRYHPDLNASPDAAVRMREINAAFAVLRDPAERERYDEELRGRARIVHDPVVVPPDPAYGDAGAPSGPGGGHVLDFGRYRGWSLEQVARADPDFLDWLERSPGGRHIRTEIADARRRVVRRPVDSQLPWRATTSW